MAKDVSGKNTNSGDVKVQHGDSGQSAIEQLLSQNKTPEEAQSAPINPEHVNATDLLNSEGVGAATVAPVFMQPNTAGKFEFAKVEYVNTIRDDKIIEQSMNLSSAQQDVTLGGQQSEFASQNFGVNLQTLAGAELGFDKIYFAEGADQAAFNAKVAGLKKFGGAEAPDVAKGGVIAGGAGGSQQAATIADTSAETSEEAAEAAEIAAEAETPVTETTIPVTETISEPILTATPAPAVDVIATPTPPPAPVVMRHLR